MPLLLRKGLRDFRAMGLRAGLVFGVLAAGVAVYVGGFSAERSVFATRAHYYETLRLSDLELQFVPVDEHELPPWLLALARGDAAPARSLGASAASLRFFVRGTLELQGRPVMSAVAHFDPKTTPQVNRLAFEAGRPLDAARTDEVLVEAGAAKVHGFKVGDRITLDPFNSPAEVTIVGIVRSPEFLLPTANPDILLPGKGSLVVFFRSIGAITEVFGEPMYNMVSLDLGGHGSSPEITHRFVSASAPLTFHTVTDRFNHFSYRFLDEDLKGFGIFIPVIAGIFGLVTFLVLLLSLSRLIAQEQRSIGALLAMGRHAREIIGGLMIAGLVYGAVAGAVGGAMSPVIGRFLAARYAHAIGLPPVIFQFDGVALAYAQLLAMGAVLLAIGLPALRIVKMTPVRAMRGDLNAGYVGVGAWLEHLWRPLTGSMARRFGLRNLTRRPKLTLAVIGLMALAMALSAAFRVIHTAWDEYAKYAFAHERWDGIVAFKVPLQPAEAAPIRATPGVVAAEPMAAGFGAICDAPTPDALCLDHRVVGIAGGEGLRVFRFKEGEKFRSNDEPAVILNRNFNHARPYRLGETVWLRHRDRYEKVRVVGLTSDMTIGLAYVPIEVARRLLDFKHAETTGFMATFSATPREAKKALFSHEMVTYVSLKAEMQEIVVAYLEIIWSIVETAMLISMVLAALFLLTGLSMAILEREGEYATLRTFGFSHLDIGRMILVEVIGETLLAVAVAVPLSMGIAKYLQYEMARAWFRVELHFLAADYLTVLVPIVLALPLAGVPAIVRLLRTPPAVLLRARAIG